mmetsp:Transcript_14249/g.45513  ORF Transcript_14249/g.45513 Transcript_14249/m.45513 type:complete len:233 (-) Transcript_14249:79-777(-)
MRPSTTSEGPRHGLHCLAGQSDEALEGLTLGLPPDSHAKSANLDATGRRGSVPRHLFLLLLQCCCKLPGDELGGAAQDALRGVAQLVRRRIFRQRCGKQHRYGRMSCSGGPKRLCGRKSTPCLGPPAGCTRSGNATSIRCEITARSKWNFVFSSLPHSHWHLEHVEQRRDRSDAAQLFAAAATRTAALRLDLQNAHAGPRRGWHVGALQQARRPSAAAGKHCKMDTRPGLAR